MGALANQYAQNDCDIVLCYSFSDFTMKYVDVEGSNQKTFHGHNAPILSVAIDPKLEYIVSKWNHH